MVWSANDNSIEIILHVNDNVNDNYYHLHIDYLK